MCNHCIGFQNALQAERDKSAGLIEVIKLLKASIEERDTELAILREQVFRLEQVNLDGEEEATGSSEGAENLNS